MSSRAEYFLESLKREMALKGLTAADVVRKSGVSSTSVYKLLNHGCHYLKQETMDKLASAVASSVLLLQASAHGGQASNSAEFKTLCARLRASRGTDTHAVTLIIMHMAYLLQKKYPAINVRCSGEPDRTLSVGADLKVSARLSRVGTYEFVVDYGAGDSKKYVTDNPRVVSNILVNHLNHYNEHST